jgi:hypothetical protein
MNLESLSSPDMLRRGFPGGAAVRKGEKKGRREKRKGKKKKP